jgi:ariadne-1
LLKFSLWFSCRYDVIENDLLGSLQLTTHHISPYKTGGAERASEITADKAPERVKQKVVPLQNDEEPESRSLKACPPVANGEWGM